MLRKLICLAEVLTIVVLISVSMRLNFFHGKDTLFFIADKKVPKTGYSIPNSNIPPPPPNKPK